MTGSARTTPSPAESVRAPYVAPQPVQNTRQQAEGNSPLTLAPFVPREFRQSALRDVMAVPAAQQSLHTPAFQSAIAGGNTERDADSIATQFAGAPSEVRDDQQSEYDDTAVVASNDSELPVSEASTELPWIDAFAADAPEPEETWPLGEAGRRLDELTQSLSSLDASRARLEASSADSGDVAHGETAEAPLPMWNEDEWIDIMPTSLPISASAPTPFVSNVVGPVRAEISADSENETESPAAAGAELTALALESLANRIRRGEVQVPQAQPHVAQEALLAGVLASMLGWRQ